MMTWKPIHGSSNIAAVGYDVDTQTLGVRFHNGIAGEYADVPADKHRAMLTAESAGKFLNREIKNKHAWNRA
jgi:hypothetical protein